MPSNCAKVALSQKIIEPKIEIMHNFVNLTIWFKDLLSVQDSVRLHSLRKMLNISSGVTKSGNDHLPKAL